MDLSVITESLVYTDGIEASIAALLDAIAGKINELADDPNALHELADSIVSHKGAFATAVEAEPPEPMTDEEAGVGEDVEEEEVAGESEYSGHTVDELKEFLTERDLPVSGTKAELIARLEEDDAEESEEA